MIDKVALSLERARQLKRQGRYPEAFSLYESIIEVLRESPISREREDQDRRVEPER